MKPHHHWIIQQIIPAPSDCYAVFALWEDDKVVPEFHRVPCFALVSRCVVAEVNASYQPIDQCAIDLNDQDVQACVSVHDGTVERYLPANDEYVNDCTNYKLIGLHYGEPDMAAWQLRAEICRDKTLKEESRKLGKEK